MEGTASWIHDAEQPDSYITLAANPSVGSGWPLRYTFHCRVCHNDHPLTNANMLRQIAAGITTNRRDIQLLKL
jgi:hypothetical protein